MPFVSDLGFVWSCCSLLIFPYLLDCTSKSLRAHALWSKGKLVFPKISKLVEQQGEDKALRGTEMHERAQFEHNSKHGADLAVKLLGVCVGILQL